MGVQVNLATKERSGKPLPFSKRQFISFSYGGKNIEDFDLVAVFPSDRLDKEIYSPFEDIVSKNETIDGQMFWQSVFQAGKLNFSLATDGMSSENYEEFKRWFSPGNPKELILSEFHNRGIMARVATAPNISFIPFEEKRTFEVNGHSYDFSTTVYKGQITLQFVMDDPHWYALESYYDTIPEVNSKDVVKVIYEDKIPLSSMFSGENRILLGDNKIYADGAIITNSGQSLVAGDSDNLYLYNCGTAPAKPIISFTLSPSLNEDKYIILPENSYVNNENPYSTLTIGSQEFRFTTPSLYTSYNYVINLFKNIASGDSILDIRNEIRDNVHNYYTRAYAIALINVLNNNRTTGAFEDGDSDDLIDKMSMLFRATEESSSLAQLNVKIDSKLGIIEINTQCRTMNELTSSSEIASFIPLEENAGDMAKSKYLKIEDRTIFSAQNTITENQCLKVWASCALSNLKVEFKYYYL